jgi:hypothetical protein
VVTLGIVGSDREVLVTACSGGMGRDIIVFSEIPALIQAFPAFSRLASIVVVPLDRMPSMVTSDAVSGGHVDA